MNYIYINRDMTNLGGTVHTDPEKAVEDARLQSLATPGIDYIVLTNFAAARDGKTKLT